MSTHPQIACELEGCAGSAEPSGRGETIQRVELEAESYALFCVDGPSPGLAKLTSAERQVASLALQGLSDREIARLRNTSARTVAHQLRAAFARLGVCSRAELAAL